MRLYLDASVLVALLTDDPLSARTDRFLRDSTPVLLLSDFAAAEFASAIARRVRMGLYTADAARTAFATLDAWAARSTERLGTVAADVSAAAAFVRRLDLPLRTPDALNIAIAQRSDAMLATFDVQMAAAARALGTVVAAA